MFSAALCRGLIEAEYTPGGCFPYRSGFPRLYAAASLKLPASQRTTAPVVRFPRLYAAASLKRGVSGEYTREPRHGVHPFSAALCRGLIEASSQLAEYADFHWFSAALCRGLIEAGGTPTHQAPRLLVFRGFMPRPH